MSSVSLYVAFLAGLISFVSPCVLPIIPGFLSFLAGSSVAEGKAPKRSEVFISTLFFVLGFSSIFALLGVLLNGVLISVAYEVQVWLSRFGGAIIIFFGLYLTGLIHLSFLDRPHNFSVSVNKYPRYITAFLFGLAFAAGWTPCVGAALGAILGLAVTAPGSAFVLLLAYALGLGLPFIVVGFFASRADFIIEKYSKYLSVINVVFGILLILIGILIFTGNLSRIANFQLLNSFLLN